MNVEIFRLSFFGLMLSFASASHGADGTNASAAEVAWPEPPLEEFFDGPPPFGPGGMQPSELKILGQFDINRDGWLNRAERSAARKFLTEQTHDRAQRRIRPPFGREEEESKPIPGSKISPADIKTTSSAPLYDLQTLRTVFLEFEDADWEKELQEFNNTDVDVPAKMTVDGQVYPDVGIHFRGASSYMMVSEGRKRSLNVSIDFVHDDQRLLGYRTLNLLNSHEDPTFLRAVLYNQIAREYLPTPKANFVRVVINGESWGIYASTEQFNKDFVKEWFGTTKGARWKVPGSPMGRGGFNYLGDNAEAYKRTYEIKSKDDPHAWSDLIHLFKALNETPTNELANALEPLLDVDGVLKFLALENALINNDGFWMRASDYSIYEDISGKFHIVPHDANETFMPAQGPGFGRRGESDSAGVKLDPLVAANDKSKPLASRLLAVPEYRARYLGYIRQIAETWLDWKKLGPIVQRYKSLIEDEVEKDTRKLYSTEAFRNGLIGTNSPGNFTGRGGPAQISIKSFAEQRREFLLNHPAIKTLKPTQIGLATGTNP